MPSASRRQDVQSRRPNPIRARLLGSLLPKTFHFSSPNPNPCFLPICTKFRTRANGKRGSNWPPPPQSVTKKKSFAVAMGEIFLGFAFLLLHHSRSSAAPVPVPPSGLKVFQDQEEAYFLGKRESIALVVEDPMEQEVIWEQRLKDLEAEKERKKPRR